MSTFPWISKFQYPASTGTTLTLTEPQKPWRYRNTSIGGYRDSGAGIRASFVIRRDNLLDVTLRVLESELAAVRSLIEYMQEHPATACTWWPDKDVTGTSYSVLLISPGAGEDISFDDGGFPGYYEITITLKKSNNAAWSMDYYG